MPVKTLMTAAEFARTGPDTDGYELVKGEVVRMPPPARVHGYVCVNIATLLKLHTKQIGHGYVMSNDTGIITVRGMDIGVFLHPSWEGKEIPDGYGDEPADLIVDVRSPTQSWSAVTAKTAEYLRMGVRQVWVVDPGVKRVTVLSPDKEPYTLAAENEIGGGEALPGFSCRVEEFFK